MHAQQHVTRNRDSAKALLVATLMQQLHVLKSAQGRLTKLHQQCLFAVLELSMCRQIGTDLTLRMVGIFRLILLAARAR